MTDKQSVGILGVLVLFLIYALFEFGYHAGYIDATREHGTVDLPVIKADPTPFKVRPEAMPNVDAYCPPAVIIQAPPKMGD